MKIKLSNINFVDLGLKSGIKWADSYNSGLIFKDEFSLMSVNDYVRLFNHMPTVENFEELCFSCKIREYRKGLHTFKLITGPNGNRVRMLTGKWDMKGIGLDLFSFWVISNQNIEAVKSTLVYNQSSSLNPGLRRFANLILIENGYTK